MPPIPEVESCMPYKGNETVYMMCVMLDQRDKQKAKEKAKKKAEQAKLAA